MTTTKKPVATLTVTITLFDDETYGTKWEEEACGEQENVSQFSPTLHKGLQYLIATLDRDIFKAEARP